MTEIDLTLLIGAVLVAGLSWRNPRGILWIGAAALSYINASIAWRLHLPYAEAITGLGDATVCLAVYFWGRERWEMWIWRLFQSSVAVSIFYLAGNLGIFYAISHDAYSIFMEAVNWLLLLLIGGIAVLQWIGASNVRARQPWSRVRRFALALQSERTDPPFTEV